MRVRLHSWRQPIKQRRITFLVVSIILVVVIGLIIVGYRFDWTGFSSKSKSGKTLWDWLQLLFVPSILTLGAVWFTSRQNHELDIAIDNQQEAALQSYIDKMSELLLKEHLGELTADSKLKPEYEQVRNIARVRTSTVLSKLDPPRKRTVLKFLFESELVDNNDNDNPIVNLSYADLKEADLNGFTLLHCNLEHTNLSNANLEKADLIGTTLASANMQSARLSEANLENVNLNGAIVTDEQLAKAKSLKGATMPDGSIHP